MADEGLMILWINMQVFGDLFGGLREFVYFCRQIVSKIEYW